MVQGYQQGNQVRIPSYQESTNQSTVIPDTISNIFNFFKRKLSGGEQLTNEETDLFNRLSNIMPEARTDLALKEKPYDPSLAMDPEYEKFMQEMIENNLGGSATNEVGRPEGLLMYQGESVEKDIEEAKKAREKNLSLIGTDMSLKNFLIEKANMSVSEADDFLINNPDKRSLSDLSTAEKLNLQNLNIEYEDPLQRLKKLADEQEKPPTTDQGDLPKELVEERLRDELTETERVDSDEKRRLEVESARKMAEAASYTANDIPKEAAEALDLGEDKAKGIQDFINQFMDNAPKPEGMDKGMLLAKIGFAMAAGKSPNALTNIAEAFSLGADMAIKDKKERDAFKRQVKLSALQYGLGEMSKISAEERLIARDFRQYVDENGNEVLVPLKDIIASGGALPEGLKDKALYLAEVKAADEREKAIRESILKRKEALVMSDELAIDQTEKYQAAVLDYQQSVTGRKLVEGMLINVAEKNVTGAGNAFQDLMNKAFNAAGLGDIADKQYESLAQFQSDVNLAFQELVPQKLGKVQSANSISNRDIEILAKAYFGTAFGKGGSFALVAEDMDILGKKLQAVLRDFRGFERDALNTMAGIESNLAARLEPDLKTPVSERLARFVPDELKALGASQYADLLDMTFDEDKGIYIVNVPQKGT
tara:strand:- start:969 stop:2927 length:1959 start_codon:yes stop_codon:yes gene_type:complete